MRLTPARSIKPADKQLSKASDNVTIRPKTVTRPPVFPKRPTSNGAQSPTAIQQFNTSQPVVSSEPPVVTTPIDTPSTAKTQAEPVLTVQSKHPDSVQGESIFDNSIQ